MGLKLQEKLNDLPNGHKGFNVRKCEKHEAIQVKLGVDGMVYVDSGHATLG